MSEASVTNVGALKCVLPADNCLYIMERIQLTEGTAISVGLVTWQH